MKSNAWSDGHHAVDPPQEKGNVRIPVEAARPPGLPIDP